MRKRPAAFPGLSRAAPAAPAAFARRLIRWQRKHGRNDLPWQNTRDAYRIWLSEIMLQQTQVGTVIPYYLRFIERFPDVQSLARAGLDDVLQAWSGLGYYSRGRNLHRTAQQVVESHGGRFPRAREALQALPGLGRSTAAAIAVFAYGGREAILDGNVKRVLARHFAVAGFPGESTVARRLWDIAESLLPEKDIASYTQGLMDLGAGICERTPQCELCPLSATCIARAQHDVSQYPSPRPRRALPHRQAILLLLVRDGEILLQRRAEAGIWGGLWSFPELLPEADTATFCETRLGCEIGAVEGLPPLRHAFTHFTLDIRPLLCRVRTLRTLVRSGHDADSLQWLSIKDAGQAAIPTPVRKLLRLLAEHCEVGTTDNNIVNLQRLLIHDL